MNSYKFIPYKREYFSPDDSLNLSREFYSQMNKRRSCRDFSSEQVKKETIENILLAAGTAPSGAHKQPWTFCVISNSDLKSKIREAAEKEEYENYHGRMSEEWLKDLAPLGTDWKKEFIDIAPWIIVIFKKSYDLKDDGSHGKNYYVNESVGIASGFLISAIHQAGLVTLTHTPSPMNFLSEVLDRPKNEKAVLLLPVGYPHKEAEVPDLKRKSLSEIAVFYE
jgi:iodotyrosine deiodinase